MTTDRQRRHEGPPEEWIVKRVVRIVIVLAAVAASLSTTACGGASLYTGVDSNGGWNAPVSRGTGTIGITGYPF